MTPKTKGRNGGDRPTPKTSDSQNNTRIPRALLAVILESHKAEILDALQPAMDLAVHVGAKPLADALLDLLICIGDDAIKYPSGVIAAQRALLRWEGLS